eukprot:sb/3468786/
MSVSTATKGAYFRLVVKKIIPMRQVDQPNYQHKYISDLGFVKLRMFDDSVPVTCQNFLDLCNHTHGFGYRSSVFHHVVRGFGLYGGDIVERTRTAQPYDTTNAGLSWSGKVESGAKPETLAVPEAALGTCGSIVCVQSDPGLTGFSEEVDRSGYDFGDIDTWCDPHTCMGIALGGYVAKVSEGMDIIHEIDEFCGSQNGYPLHYVEITQSGVLNEDQPHLPPSIPLDELNVRTERDTLSYTKEPLYIE